MRCEWAAAPVDHSEASPAAVAPSSRVWMAAETASRFSTVITWWSPAAAATTTITGARRYFTRALATLAGFSSPAAMRSSANASPSAARASPASTRKRHG